MSLTRTKKAQLKEMMALTCDNINWAIVDGVLYKKEGTCPVASCPNCIRRMPMSKYEMLKEGVTGKKWPRFYKILREKEFNSYSELRAALKYENG